MSYTHNEHQSARDDILSLQEKVSEGRREFFKQVGQGAVATAVATTAMQMGVRPHMKPAVQSAAAAATGGWKNLFSLKPGYLYMNIGTTGSTPTAILDEYEQWYYDVAWKCNAYSGTANYCVDAVTGAARDGITPFGCNPYEFVMSFTTTDGMMKCLEGQNWQAGQNVIVTNMEHGGGMGPLMCVASRYGVNRPKLDVVWVNKVSGAEAAAPGPNVIPAVKAKWMVLAPTGIRKDPAEKIGYPTPSYLHYAASQGRSADYYFWHWFLRPQFVRAYADYGNKAAAVMVSSPPYLNGVRLPEMELCNDFARPRNLRTTIDAAHLTGMININLHAMGVDFFAGSGHKWHCGPGQTGIAYIRNGNSNSPNWSASYQGGTRTGTGLAYGAAPYTSAAPDANGKGGYGPFNAAIPEYWPWNDGFRNAQYMVAPENVVPGVTPTRQFYNGYRDPAQNAGGAMQSIGNNSIPLNRALYECIMLWNSIGRHNIDNYVVTLAQYLRWLTSRNTVFDGSAAPGSALYAHVQDFRKAAPTNKVGADLTWADVWNPVNPDGSTNTAVPVWCRCGLTSWNPIQFGSETSGPDYNRPLTVAESTAHIARTGNIITYLNNTYGMYARNTAVPHMMRFSDPNVMLAANANANFMPSNGGTSANSVNRSQPFRLSTHLFHDLADIESFNNVWNDPQAVVLRDMLRIS